MTQSEYQKLAQRTECDTESASIKLEEPRAARVNHAMLGLCNEVGELAGTIKKWLYYGQEINLTEVKEEIGDLSWFVALMCNALDLDLEHIMRLNIAKLRCRFPSKFDETLCREENRDRGAEKGVIEGDY